MSTSQLLLQALEQSVSEFGQNHLQTGKLRQFIALNHPAQKDAAFKIVSKVKAASSVSGASSVVSAKSTSGFGGRTPINLGELKNSPNISQPIPTPENVVAKTVIADISENEASVADDNVQPEFKNFDEFAETDIQTLVEYDEDMLLATYGRVNLQNLGVKLGFSLDIRKSDKAYTTNFKKALIKALK